MISIRLQWEDRQRLTPRELNVYHALLTIQEQVENCCCSGVTLERMGLSLYTVAAASMEQVAASATALRLVDEWTRKRRVWETRTGSVIERRAKRRA
jgi:hypothetical protein